MLAYSHGWEKTIIVSVKTAMKSTTQQDQLEIVSALAASLADRMLMERLTQGKLPLANASRLWTASLLLEEHARPIPRIVTDVLEEVRHVEPDDGDEADGIEAQPGPEVDLAGARRPARPARRRGLTRLLRPFRQAAEA
ncbi:hypothetical protein ME121_4977 [Methylobacterium sp. ME121]|nr:hypothetical protein ME121_4977 [Methylobacterium sp. ME121]GEM99569.1 hypothetical protein MRA01_41090 [Methylobacterium radiotolerans]